MRSMGCTFFTKAFILIFLALQMGGCGDSAAGSETASSGTSEKHESGFIKREYFEPTPDEAELVRKRFVSDVVPIIEKRCANSCHAIAQNNYAAYMENPANQKYFNFPFDSTTGKIPENYLDQVYQVVTSDDRIDYEADGRFSKLVRVPLADDYGGLPHKGLDVFYSTDDKDYKTLVSWINEVVKTSGRKVAPLPENIEYFRNNVLGVMQRNGCFVSSCHGSDVFNDLKLTPPVPTPDVALHSGIDNGFSRKMVLENRKAVLGKVARFVNFNGDLAESRMILKGLPIAEGGVHQRGGNIQFFDSMQDQDVVTLLKWFSLERQALANHLTSDGKPIDAELLGKNQGLVFVRGPRHTPRTFFSFDEFYPGSDIFLLHTKPGETLENTSAVPINLTAALTNGKSVEIQSIDVRYDARRIVFSMRTRADEGFRIYEIRLNEQLDGVEGSLRQLSFAPERLKDGTLIHHVDPIYSPGPDDEEGHALDNVAVSFASNEAGQYALSSQIGILGEVDNGQGNVIVDANRPEAPGTFNGRRMYFVSGPYKGEWRTITEHRMVDGPGSGSELILDKPLPGKLDRTTTYVIEVDKGVLQSSFDIWRFVPAPEDSGVPDEKRYKQTAHQMTFSYAQERDPTMRTSGEVMFTSVRNLGYQGDKPVFNGAIYRVQAGGFDYHIQGGNRSGYQLFSDSREMGSGIEVREVHDPRNLWRGGLLVLADHGLGVNVESDNPADNTPFSFNRDNSDVNFTSVPRFVPTMAYFFPENGAHAVTNTGISPGGSVREPYPLYDNSVLVSYTPESLNHLDRNADPDWDIYEFKFDKSQHSTGGQRTGEFRKIRIDAASSKMAEYSARPLMIRVKENAEAPIEHQKFGSAARQNKPIMDFGVKRYPGDAPGEIECYDYPLLASFLVNFQPTEARDFHLEKGNPNGKITPENEVYKYVRIIMQLPTDKKEMSFLAGNPGINDPFATPVSLGVHNERAIVAEVPIEEDGSFYVQVPTQVPLIVQGLNKDRMALHSMNRWFYLQPGEKLTFSIPRSIFPLRCAGCHGSLTQESTEGVGPADFYTASSNVMATWNQADGIKRKPFGLGQKSSDYVTVDFQRDVQPILDKHCIACHDGGAKDNGLDLRGDKTRFYTRSYENLHQLRDPKSGNFADKKYVDEREALSGKSRVIKMLVDDNGNQHTKGMALSSDEMLTLIRWVDLGATFKGGNL